jgi:hypothetical protein
MERKVKRLGFWPISSVTPSSSSSVPQVHSSDGVVALDRGHAVDERRAGDAVGLVGDLRADPVLGDR